MASHPRGTLGAFRRGKTRQVLSGVAAAAAGSGGTGDTVGPASATDGDVAVFDGVTGKLLKDTGKVAADLVTGPAASIDDEVALFSSTTGKVIKRASSTGRPKLTAGVLSVGAIDLTSEVTGDLPLANIAQQTALSVLGVTGNATADLAAIVASTDKQVLRRSGTAVAFGAVDLASSDAVTGLLALANLADLAALSVLGRAANSSGVQAAIAAANDYEVLRRSGTSIGFGTVATGGIADAAITLAKLADLAQATVIGRQSGAGTGVPQALTSTDLLAIIGSVAGTPGAFYSYAGNPQGNFAAPLYSVCVNSTNGNLFQKFGGGSTVYGWYYMPNLFSGYGPSVSGWRNLLDGSTGNTLGSAIGTQAWQGTATRAGEFIGGYPYLRHDTTGSSGNIARMAGAITGNDLPLWDTDFDFVARIAIPATITSLRYHVGLITASITDQVNGVADSSSSSHIMLRFATDNSDAGWVLTTKQGANNVSNTAALNTLGAGSPTATVLRIRKVGSTVYASVDDGTETTQTNNLPAAGLPIVFPNVSVTTKTGAVRSIYLKEVAMTQGAL